MTGNIKELAGRRPAPLYLTIVEGILLSCSKRGMIDWKVTFSPDIEYLSKEIIRGRSIKLIALTGEMNIYTFMADGRVDLRSRHLQQLKKDANDNMPLVQGERNLRYNGAGRRGGTRA